MTLLEELVRDIVISGEEISTTLTINGSPEVYTLLEERGDGGQGTLYKAQCGDAIVAVKILDRKPKADELERFAFWQRLGGVSGVTHLLAHGISSLELRNYAVVSDYVEGVTLEQLRARTPLSEEAVREILLQAATVLGDIHEEKVLHRDIKPSNIMIDRSGVVSITDFGAARNADVHTLTATMMGTPSYLAPEQYQKPSSRSDLYSLGLTFYYAMKGEHPPLLPALEYKRDLSFEEFEGEYSPHLVSIVQKMCDHVAEKRYQNAREVLDALAGNNVVVQDAISDLEKKVKSSRNFALVTGAAMVGGYALVLFGGQYEATRAGVAAMWIGSSFALTGLPGLGFSGLHYWSQRRELKDLKKRLQIEESATTPVLVPEVVVLSAADVERKGYLEREIASLEMRIANFQWYRSVAALGIIPFAIPLDILVGGNSIDQEIANLKSPYTVWKAKKRLPKAKRELEILVEQNPEVKNLLIQKQRIDKLSPWLGDVVQYSVSIMATAAATYTAFTSDTRQTLINAGIAASICVAEKIAWGYSGRKDRKELGDKITAIRQLSETTTLEELITEQSQTQLELKHKALADIRFSLPFSFIFGGLAVAKYIGQRLGYDVPISYIFSITLAVGMPITQAGLYYFTTRDQREKRNELAYQIEIAQKRLPAPEEPYLLVEWQERALRTSETEEKSLLTYEDHRIRLRGTGFERLPTCAEQMSLIIAGLEGRLDPKYHAVFADMMNGSSEWTCESAHVVVEKKGSIFQRETRRLQIYKDVQLYHKGTHFEPKDVLSDPIEIDIGLASGRYTNLWNVRAQLLTHFFFYGYANIPAGVKQEGGITIPEPDGIWPIYRNKYHFEVASPQQSFAIRGVREKK